MIDGSSFFFPPSGSIFLDLDLTRRVAGAVEVAAA
jgi:hypothetical protein